MLQGPAMTDPYAVQKARKQCDPEQAKVTCPECGRPREITLDGCCGVDDCINFMRLTIARLRAELARKDELLSVNRFRGALGLVQVDIDNGTTVRYRALGSPQVVARAWFLEHYAPCEPFEAIELGLLQPEAKETEDVQRR